MHNLDLSFNEILDEIFDVEETINDQRVLNFCKELL
jgi:hypothetical protein